MAKLTKAEAKAHGEALTLLEKDELTDDDRIFIMENWQESANHVNSIAGAFFTPHGLAMDAALDVYYGEGRIIDLCAGIGSLSLAAWWRGYYDRRDSGKTLEMVCVELNPEYVALGRKMLPEAEWICGSIFDLPDLGHFTQAISNPPFGNIKTGGDWKGKYTGSKFEYRTIEIASQIADCGMFIVPQQSAGFRYSGAAYYQHSDSGEFTNREYAKFAEQTGIRLDAGVGVDTSVFDDAWHGVSPRVEIAIADFTELHRDATVTPLEPSDGLDFGEWEAAS
jgi:hypothetical protein